mgnify:CR=1 FL=1
MVVFLYFYLKGPNLVAPLPLFVLFVWVVHYANRGFLMPALIAFRLRANMLELSDAMRLGQFS